MNSPKFLAKRMLAVPESPTARAFGRAAELRRQGRSILPLGVGELDFPTPPHICEAAIRAIHDGKTRYTPVPGIPALIEAIQHKLARRDGLAVPVENILTGSGAKQLIHAALAVTLNPGDRALIPVPSWVSYPDIVRLYGGEPLFLPCPADKGFKLDQEMLTQGLASAREGVRWLILNSPNNPTGATYSAEEYRLLADVLTKHPDLFVLADDIYEELTYEGGGQRSLVQSLVAVAPELSERILTVNGVSKAYAMTGFRLGYAHGPAWLMRAMSIFISQSTTHACSVSQAAAVAALEGPQDFLEGWRSRLRSRRDVLMQGLATRQDGEEGLFRANTPDGAFYIFADCGGLLGRTTTLGRELVNDSGVAAWLLEEMGIAAVAGTAFGMEPYVRFSFAVSDDDLGEAIRRLGAASWV